MIKLEKGDPPDFLTPEKVVELTNSYSVNNKATVWRDSAGLIKDSLLRESHKKCVYCECLLERAGAGLEVDHHKPKNDYPELVVQWENLVASCRRCNSQKGTKEEILNPFEKDPKNHISHQSYRYYGIDELGRNTLDRLNLNDRVKLVEVRFKIGDKINSMLDDVSNNSSLISIRNSMIGILRECIPSSEFSAIASTTLHENPVYGEIMDRLKEAKEWSDDLENLHQESLKIKLNPRY